MEAFELPGLPDEDLDCCCQAQAKASFEEEANDLHVDRVLFFEVPGEAVALLAASLDTPCKQLFQEQNDWEGCDCEEESARFDDKVGRLVARELEDGVIGCETFELEQLLMDLLDVEDVQVAHLQQRKHESLRVRRQQDRKERRVHDELQHIDHAPEVLK